MTTLRKWLKYLVLIAVTLCICAFIENTIWWQHFIHAAGPAQEELLDLYQVLEPGRPETDIAEVWQRFAPKHLTITFMPNRGCYFVNAPKSLFYRDWLLLVRVEEGQTVEVAVRTRDSISMHPDGAPPDKSIPPTPLRYRNAGE